MDGLIKVVPDKKKAKSILKMAETSIKMIETIDERAFPSNLTKEYYDTLKNCKAIFGVPKIRRIFEHSKGTYFGYSFA